MAEVKVDVVPESDSLALRRAEKGSHHWAVRNYSSLKEIGGVDRAIESDEFTVGGHRWVLQLFPYGKTEKAYKSRSASLFFTLKDDDNDSSRINNPVHLFLEMYLVNQSGNDDLNYWGPLCPGEKTLVYNLECKRSSMCGHLHFIHRNYLDSPRYLKDDCLKFHCNVTVITSQIRVSLPSIKVPGSNIGAHLGKLLESKKGADVFFSVNGARFCAHKWILSARSHVFRSMLLDSQSRDTITIPDMEHKVFKAMLWFIYTGNLKQEEDEGFNDAGLFMHKSFVGRMLAAADQFDLKKLKKMCESRISEKISGESAAYLLHLADLYHAVNLKDACIRFAAENRDVVLESVGCEYLKETYPLLFVEIAYTENPCSSKGELGLCSRFLSTLKEPLVGMFSILGASDVEHKIKED